MPLPDSQELRWSFSTLGCPDLSLPGAAVLARQFGVGSLELRALEGRLDLPRLFEELYGAPGDLQRELSTAGVNVSVLDSSFWVLGEWSEAEWEELKALARWGIEIECPWIRVFDGGEPGGSLSSSDINAFQKLVDRWSSFQAEEGSQVGLIVETHGLLTASPLCSQLQESLRRPFPLLWDAHHTWKLGGEDPLSTWENLKQWVVHVHVKDSRSDPAQPSGYRYVLPGVGEFPLRTLLARLSGDRPGLSVSLEWEKKWHPDLPPLEEALHSLSRLGT